MVVCTYNKKSLLKAMPFVLVRAYINDTYVFTQLVNSLSSVHARVPNMVICTYNKKSLLETMPFVLVRCTYNKESLLIIMPFMLVMQKDTSIMPLSRQGIFKHPDVVGSIECKNLLNIDVNCTILTTKTRFKDQSLQQS